MVNSQQKIIDKITAIRNDETKLKKRAIKETMGRIKKHYLARYPDRFQVIKTSYGFKLITIDNDKTLPIIKARINHPHSDASDTVEPASDITITKTDYLGLLISRIFIKVKPPNEYAPECIVLSKHDLTLIKTCPSKNNRLERTPQKYRLFRFYEISEDRIGYKYIKNIDERIKDYETSPAGDICLKI